MAANRDNTERTGVNAVEAIFLRFKWAFRPQPISDYGIDAQVEIWEDEKFEGKLIALQIKGGPSYFARKRDSNVVFRDTIKHLNYWLKQPIPVFLILYNPVDDKAIWQKIEERFVVRRGSEFEILVPKTNILNEESKIFFAEGIPSDEKAIRRFNLEFDQPSMQLFKDKLVFFEINDWVNKSLNIRDINVYFDDHYKENPYLRIHIWTPAQSIDTFMNLHYPWLEYDHVDTDETLGGEVEVYTLEVRLNNLAKSYLAVEEYIENGPPEPNDESDGTALDPDCGNF